MRSALKMQYLSMAFPMSLSFLKLLKTAISTRSSISKRSRAQVAVLAGQWLLKILISHVRRCASDTSTLSQHILARKPLKIITAPQKNDPNLCLQKAPRQIRNISHSNGQGHYLQTLSSYSIPICRRLCKWLKKSNKYGTGCRGSIAGLAAHPIVTRLRKILFAV